VLCDLGQHCRVLVSIQLTGSKYRRFLLEILCSKIPLYGLRQRSTLRAMNGLQFTDLFCQKTIGLTLNIREG